MAEERRNSDHTFTLLMDKLNGMDNKFDSMDQKFNKVQELVNKHEIDIASAKLLGKMAHFIGWPALMAGIHNMWKHWN